MAYQTKKGTKCTVGTGRRERLVESPRTVMDLYWGKKFALDMTQKW
jgi:hypothetical protein